MSFEIGKEVLPDGKLTSKIAIIGEAPGVTEVAVGIGFSGMSGKVLWDIVGRFGITRGDCYVSNVIKVKPAKEDLSDYVTFRNGVASPTTAFKEYRDKLFLELNQLENCNIVVAVGNVALYALTGKVSIKKWRGSILSCALVNGKILKVIPIIHPAAALREYSFMHMIHLDVAKIADEMQFPELRLPVRNLITSPSFVEAVHFLEEVKKLRIVAYDIEVINEEISCISFAPDDVTSICIPFVKGGTDYFTLDQEAEIMIHIADILQDKEITKVGQNLAFDSTFLFTKYGIVMEGFEDNHIDDTMIGQAIAFPDYPKGLDFITSVYTREAYYKDEGKRWFKAIGNEHDFWIYNAKDSVVCMEALPRIKDNLEKLFNLDTYYEQVKLIPSLTYMQYRGIKIDVEGLEEEKKRTDSEISRLTEELNKQVGRPINHGSPKQLVEYFYNEKGIKPYVNRKTHLPTTDEDALKRIARKGYEEASTILKLRHLSKMKGTYLEVTLDKDKRLRCSFNPVGSAQGRLSSSETIFGTGTNMQNLPEEFRKFLIADDGCLMFNIDLSQAENRAVSYIAPEPTMIDAFEKKIDVHSLTGALISGLTIEEVTRQDKADVKCPLGGGSFTWRFWGKKANHGLNYDLGYKTFALKYEIQESDAKFIVDRYHKIYPGVRMYHSWVKEQLFKNRTLTNIFGRRRMFTDRWGDEMFKVAYSFIPQSTVADIINRRGLNNIYFNQDKYYPVDLLLQVHDSILFQIDYTKYSWETIAHTVLQLIEDLTQPLKWGTREFTIPAGLMIGTCFAKKKMIEVETNGTTTPGLAQRISGVYEQLRTSVHV